MVRTTPFLVAFALFLTLVPNPGAAQNTGVEYQLIIDCPTTQLFLGNPLSRTPGMTCPIRAVDADDQMGDPSLAVDPFEPENLILASLHGGSGCGGPTVKSRCGGVFTTFTSTNHGASWVDRPFSAPAEVGSGSFGEHPQVTIDPYGRVYVGSLYAQRTTERDEFNYVIAAQKFSNIQTIQREQDGSYNAEYLDPVYMGNRIGQMWFLFNPLTDNMTMVWHENVTKISENRLGRDNNDCQPPPPPRPITSQSASSSSTTSTSSSSTTSSGSSSSSGTNSSSSTSSSPALGTVTGTLTRAFDASPAPAALRPASENFDAWNEPDAAPEPGSRTMDDSAAITKGPHGVIGVVWTGSSLSACYQYQPHKWVIGPCLRSTNPVLSEGWLYVGCVASTEEGNFTYNPDTVHGQVEMFRMNPNGGEPQYIGSTPIHGGLPKLGVRSDGRLALATANGTGDGRLDVTIAFGHYEASQGKIIWSSTRGYGNDIARVDPAIQIVDAAIQDLLFREHSGVVHFILKTNVKPSGTVIDAARDSLLPDYRKMIVAVSEEFGVLAKLPLDIGNAQNRSNDAILLNANEAAYNDLSDDYLELPQVPMYEYTDRAGRTHQLENYQREFFAIGDYGVILFAEVIELTNLKGPAFPNPAQPPIPNPAPAATTATTSVTVPAAGLTMAGALALALISTKRKEAAIVRARKKRGP